MINYTSRSDRWVKLPAPPQRHDNFYIISPLIHSFRNTLYVSLYKATIFHPAYEACVRFLPIFSAPARIRVRATTVHACVRFSRASPKTRVRRISAGLSSPDLQGLREKLFISAGHLLRHPTLPLASLSRGRNGVLPARGAS